MNVLWSWAEGVLRDGCKAASAAAYSVNGLLQPRNHFHVLMTSQRDCEISAANPESASRWVVKGPILDIKGELDEMHR